MTEKRDSTVRHRKDSDFDRMKTAKFGLDKYQSEAGDTYRELCYKAESSIQAMDPAKDIVDGGKPKIDIPTAKADAAQKLGKASRVLGISGEFIVKSMCFYDVNAEAVAAQLNRDTTKRAGDRIRSQLKIHLTDLAEHFGIVKFERRHSSYFSRDGKPEMFVDENSDAA